MRPRRRPPREYLELQELTEETSSGPGRGSEQNRDGLTTSYTPPGGASTRSQSAEGEDEGFGLAEEGRIAAATGGALQDKRSSRVTTYASLAQRELGDGSFPLYLMYICACVVCICRGGFGSSLFLVTRPHTLAHNGSFVLRAVASDREVRKRDFSTGARPPSSLC